MKRADPFSREDLGTYNLVSTRRRTWRASCSKCNSHHEIDFSPSTPNPEMIFKRFRQAGWTLAKRHKTTCPDDHRKVKPVANRTDNPPMHASDAVGSGYKGMAGNSDTPAVAIVPGDPKLARKLFALLDEVFDDKSRTYAKGQSDATVAHALSVSETYVKKVREEAYGKIAEDPVLAEIRKELRSLEEDSRTLTTMLNEQNKKINSLTMKLAAHVQR